MHWSYINKGEYKQSNKIELDSIIFDPILNSTD